MNVPTKSVTLLVPEIIGGTQKIGQYLDTLTALPRSPSWILGEGMRKEIKWLEMEGQVERRAEGEGR